MASLNFIGGEKGGVGKSVVARLLAQYFIDKEIPFIGFDTDRSHASFQRFYSDFAARTMIEDYESLDHIIEAVTEQPNRQVLVDLAAQTMPPLSRWIEDSDVIALLKETETPVRFWHVMDDGVDSLGMLERLLALFGASVSYVIVLNHGRGTNFDQFQASGARTQALKLGAKIIELRKLHDASMRKIDQQNASFWFAINSRGGADGLGMLERQRVKIWLAKTYADFESVLQ
jgi:hypothetical protein